MYCSSSSIAFVIMSNANEGLDTACYTTLKRFKLWCLFSVRGDWFIASILSPPSLSSSRTYQIGWCSPLRSEGLLERYDIHSSKGLSALNVPSDSKRRDEYFKTSTCFMLVAKDVGQVVLT
jgi:hypothetical protein